MTVSQKETRVRVEEGPQKWVPRPYMVKAVKWLVEHGAAGLFLDPGLGKTSITLAALKILKRDGAMTKGALVITPLRPLYNVWDAANSESELRKWLDFAELKTAVLHGPKKDAALRSRADLYLINPEGLDWLARQRGALPFDVLVLYESTALKRSNT